MRRYASVLVAAAIVIAAVPSSARRPERLRVGIASALFKSKAPTHSLAWLTEKPIAHRGYHGKGRLENSMSAFREAVKRGLPFELDAHLLSDGTLAVFHDSTLDRMTHEKGPLHQLSGDAARKVRLKGSQDTIPLLSDVLKMVDGKVPVIIELKGKTKLNGRHLGRTVAEELKRYNGKYVVMSFNPYLMRWFRKNAPDIPRGQLGGDFDGKRPWIGKRLFDSLKEDFLSRPHFIAHNVEALPFAPVRFAREKLGKPVLTWTVKSPEMETFAREHADNIIFNPWD